jgi:hypothetical protein
MHDVRAQLAHHRTDPADAVEVPAEHPVGGGEDRVVGQVALGVDGGAGEQVVLDRGQRPGVLRDRRADAAGELEDDVQHPQAIGVGGLAQRLVDQRHPESLGTGTAVRTRSGGPRHPKW